MTAPQNEAAHNEAAQKQAHEFAAQGLSLGYESRRIVSDLDLTIPAGRVTVIVGANASGKSTTLRGMARLLKPEGGVVSLDSQDIHSLSAKDVARVVGILPQSPIAPEGITVGDLVGRGRYPHQGWFRQWSVADDIAVTDALTVTSSLDLVGRRMEELSGGQRQRVWIAMALAQDPDILLLDEPTTFLDVRHQLDVLDLLATLNRSRHTTVVMVLHDLNLAARYADELVVMCEGRIIANGSPADVLTPELLQEAFGLEAMIAPDPVCGTPMVVPIGKFHAPGIDAL
jgi:iron complex transport system ATP-binding protein